MKILMTGGGSAGHITPILSVATELKKLQPESNIRYVGQKGDKLNSLVASTESIQASYFIFAGKWRRYHGIGIWAHIKDWRTILKNIRDLFLFIIGYFQSIWLMLNWRPNVIFVKGGFVGLPVGLAAVLLRIPIVTHDSDSLPGLTNRLLARFSRKQCVALPTQYYKQYNQLKLVHTGVPTSGKYHALSNDQKKHLKNELGIPVDSLVLTVFGGSLGAVRVNNAIFDNATEILTKLPSLHLLHVTGEVQADEMAAKYATLSPTLFGRVQLWSFLPNLHEITGVADVVVARAGATSIAELGMQKKAVILVPNPYLVGGHQTHNARLVESENAAIVVSEKQLSEVTFDFGKVIRNLITDKNQQIIMANNLERLTVLQSAVMIAEVIIEVAN